MRMKMPARKDPEPLVLEKALREAHRSNMRMETTVLGRLILRPRQWRTIALDW
jgi:hypothetical protein